MKLLIQLSFKGGIHLGSDYEGFGVENVRGFAHSDTIFSAMVYTLAQIRSQLPQHDWLVKLLDDKVPPTQQELPFRISSFGFAMENESEAKLYIHRPLNFPKHLMNADELALNGKAIKRNQFISLDNFRQWQLGKPIDVPRMLQEIPDMFWVPEMRTQHLTDNNTLATQIYRTGMVYYPAGITPFFLVNLNEEMWSLNEFLIMMNTLKYNGLGGRRSSGCGLFEFDDSNWFFIDKNPSAQKQTNPQFNEKFESDLKKLDEILSFDGEYMMTLSTFYPESFNQDDLDSYQLVQRKGWLLSHASGQQYKRKSCFMFGEGSIFKKHLAGKLVDVTPDNVFDKHRVYKCGIPFVIPMSRESVYHD